MKSEGMVTITMNRAFLGILLILVVAAGITLVNGNANDGMGSEGTIDDDSDEEEERKESIRLAPEAQLTEQEAIEIALTVYSDGEITDVELEKEDGRIVYAVEFTKNGLETDVKLDAKTGKVLKLEKDVPGSDADLVWEFE